jgi:hypothetical protein
MAVVGLLRQQPAAAICRLVPEPPGAAESPAAQPAAVARVTDRSSPTVSWLSTSNRFRPHLLHGDGTIFSAVTIERSHH